MTRSIVEVWGLLVKWPSKNDAHRWRRSDDRRTMRPTGRGEYGNNRVQEIVSGTHFRRLRFNRLPFPACGSVIDQRGPFLLGREAHAIDSL